MRRPLAALFLLVFVFLVVGAFAFLRSQAAADLLCAQVEARGGELVGGTVLVGRCELDPMRIELAFHEIAVRVPERGLAVDIASVRLKLRRLQAPSERVLVDALEIDAPRIRIDLSRFKAIGREDDRRLCEVPYVPIQVLDGRVRSAEVVLVEDGAERWTARGLSLTTHDWGENQSLDIEIEGGRAAAFGHSVAYGDVAARANVSTDPLRLDLETLSASLEGLSLSAREVEFEPCKLAARWKVEGEGALEAWMALAGRGEAPPGTQGRLRLMLEGEGSLDEAPALAIDASFRDARLSHFVLGDTEVRARLDGDAILLERARTDAMAGELLVEGRVSWAPPYEADLGFQVHGGSLEALVAALGLPGAWVDGHISGRGRVRGPLQPLSLDGEADLSLDDFLVLDRAVRDGPAKPGELFLKLPRARIRAPLRVDADAITVTNAEVRLPNSRLDLEGAFPLSASASLQVKGRLDPLDLGTDLPRIADLPYGGEIEGPFTLSGPYSDLRIEGRLNGRSFMVDGLQAGVVTGDVVFDGGTLTLRGAVGQRGKTRYALERGELYLYDDPKDFVFDVTVTEGRLEDIIPALEDWHPLARAFRGARGSAAGTVHVDGPLETVSFTLDGYVSRGVVLGQPVSALTVRGGLEHRERLRIDELSGRLGESDRFSLRGFAILDGELGLSLSLRDVPLEKVTRLPVEELSGRISGDLVIGGTWQAPLAKGGLALSGLTLGKVSLDSGNMIVDLEGDRLGLRGGIGDGWLAYRGEAELSGRRFSLDLDWNEAALERWWPLLGVESLLGRAWRASSRGSLHVEGDPSREESWQGKLELGTLTLDGRSARIALDGPASIAIRDGMLATRRLAFSSGTSSLVIRGSASRTRELDLTLEGGLDLATIAAFLPEIGDAGGALEIRASIGGTYLRPTLVGSGSLKGGRLSLTWLPFEVSELTGDLSFSQRAIVFDDFRGIAGRGRIDLSGELRLERLMPQRIHLVTRLDEVRLMPTEGLKVTLAGGLFLDGPASDLFLSGDLELVRGRYEADLGIESLLPWARERRSADPFGSSLPLRLDVALHVPGTLRLLTPEIDARVRGDLRLVGTLASPGLLGTAEALSAEAKFRGNRFRVSHAVADFHSPDRIDFTFDVNAEAEIRDYRVFVHAFGSPDVPRVALSSEPELAEADLLTLLTLGMTARDAEGLASGEAAFAVMDALFAATGLDRQVERFLPENEILRAPRLQLTSGYSKETGQVQPRVAFESRLFTDALRLRYSAPIGISGQRAVAEFRITDKISAQAEWDTEDRQSQMGNLGVDIKLRWEME